MSSLSEVYFKLGNIENIELTLNVLETAIGVLVVKCLARDDGSTNTTLFGVSSMKVSKPLEEKPN